MLRSTFSIEEELLFKIRSLASKERRTIGSVVNSLLRKALKNPSEKKNRKDFVWKTFSAGDVLADVNDRDALEAAMNNQ